MKKVRTPAEARAWLSYQGISVAQWARENNFPYSLTQEILSGKKKCLRGMSHNIAVTLGMKEGEITTRPGRGTPVPRKSQGKPQARAQALPLSSHAMAAA